MSIVNLMQVYNKKEQQIPHLQIPFTLYTNIYAYSEIINIDI